jgi:hypothetical protein
MGKIGDTVKILLDIDKVLTSDDIASLAGISGKQTAQNQ